MQHRARLALYEIQPVLRNKIRNWMERVGHEVLFEGPLNDKTARPDADIWIVKWTYALKADLLDVIHPKRGIISLTAGTDHIDKATIKKHGLLLDNCASSPSISVAEHALALAFAAIIKPSDLSSNSNDSLIFRDCSMVDADAIVGNMLIHVRNLENAILRAKKYDYARRDISWSNPEITGSKVTFVGNDKRSSELARILSLGFNCELFGINACEELHAFGISETNMSHAVSNSNYIFVFNDAFSQMRQFSISCEDIYVPEKKFIGSKVGVIGAGRIGSFIAKIAKLGFRCDVVAFDNNTSGALEGIGVKYVNGLSEAISDRDFLFITIPFTKSTEMLIDKNILSEIKTQDQVIVNVSRDEVIDSRTILSLLDQGRVLRYASDVVPEEKRLISKEEPSEHAKALLEHPGVIIVPHEGEASAGTILRAVRESLGKVERMLGDTYM